MEIEGEDGSKIVLNNVSKAVFGRGLGFNTNDRTVSRRHVSLEMKTPVEKIDTQIDPRVSFQVLGRNPIWVLPKKSGEIKVYKKFEKGEVVIGDWLCVSSQTPVWFTLKKNKIEERENELAECIDVSEIDPVKATVMVLIMGHEFMVKVIFGHAEYGFLVMGHEFDHYPKKMIRDVKNWDWFLEEPRKDTEDDEDFERKDKRGMRRKRKKAEGNEDDDEWTEESEDDKEIVAKLRKAEKPKYSTRSMDHNKTCMQRKRIHLNEEDIKNDEDEDLDTLGGFIVNEDNVEQEEEGDEDEEEEEFVEDDDDDEEIDD